MEAINEDKKLLNKLNLKCDEELWSKVGRFKYREGIDTMNDAVLVLIKIGLDAKDIVD